MSFRPETALVAPESGSQFSFPFPPYDIQLDLMRSLYTVVERGQVGIFESPTGTGKSLTLTCGVLSWLRDHEALVERELTERIEALRGEIGRLERETAGAVDWISGQFETIGIKKQLGELKGVKDLRDEYYKRLDELREKRAKFKKRFRKKTEENLLESDGKIDVENGNDDFLVEESDDDEDVGAEEEDRLRYQPVQVIFCSRTHSQLSQVVNEVRRTEFGKQIRLTMIASRQNLCINQEVRKLKTNTLVNERCLEMQKNSGKATCKDEDGNVSKKRKVSSSAQKCPFYNREAIEELKNNSLFEVQDIEELVSFAKQEKACPYYASRAAVGDTQLLMVPYQNLLHRKTREQTGLDIKNAVIIVDEAHNLLDTISSIHSQEVSLECLQQARLQLTAYKKQYFQRFSTKNLLKINQLLFIATRLCKMLEVAPGADSRMIQTHELMTEGDFFNLNLQEIVQFAEKSRIAQKVHGFAQSVPQSVLLAGEKKRPAPQDKSVALKSFLKQLEKDAADKGKKKPAERDVDESENQNPEVKREPVVNAIRPLLAFIESLAESFDDGRVLLTYNATDPKRATMKYLLLNPGARFGDILGSCRSIILAGGTMHPIDELTEQLFKDCAERVEIRSYRHVVPADAVLPLAIGKGPSGKELLFNYANRQNKELLNELSSVLANLCQVVPHGIVCFFASYDYLDQFYATIQTNGRLDRITERKRVFREPRGTTNVDSILAEYAQAARHSGALMLSVVGGKLSEGLNFADELGRCVVVVGLPYPNRTSPELAERMRYLDRTLKPPAGNEYYENLCMKAVNQCIGRAVRHIRDYASVVLLDSRYGTSERIRKKLPVWIADGLQCTERYGQAHGSLVKFFKGKAIHDAVNK
ncbi:fanconi anemia group J protein [Culex quinquefasciatus]|uniref:DNA 5'-3' helicase n=1 Tax=Culex quinquefasciatus TaxID=7176 RepID=B0W2A2_CULQU|nr:ATP-dependent DNA helicase DDX11 [Culex quinquefasciatus]EDS28717.1 fanconi anemia group J protein [Culex quinquefasciatus]|eukprot:XP_001842874.1 fanconi anemia group J protein [Culex quinquefasciatus]